MDSQTIGTIIMTLITVLGGNAAWKYYEYRLNYKLEQKKLESKEDAAYTKEFKDRVDRLEKLLADAKAEKDELRQEIIKLTAETSEMRIELEYVIKENELLRKIIGHPATPKRTVKKKKK